jgi:hypothetical protein
MNDLRDTINEFMETYFEMEEKDIPLIPRYDFAFIGVGRQQYGDPMIIYDGNKYRGNNEKVMRLTKEPISKALKRYEGTIKEGGESMAYTDLNDAYIGTGHLKGKQPLMVYDAEKCITTLTKQFSKDPQEGSDPYEDAVEWFSFNTEGAYCGPGTPVLARTLNSFLEAYGYQCPRPSC